MNLLARIATGLIVAVGGSFLIKALNTKKSADNLIIDFDDVSNLSLKNKKISFDLKFSAANPTINNLNIEQMLLDVVFKDGGPTVAKIRSFDPIMVPAQKMITKNINIETASLLMNGINIINQVINLLTGGSVQKPDRVIIAGKIKANGILTDYRKEILFKQ